MPTPEPAQALMMVVPAGPTGGTAIGISVEVPLTVTVTRLVTAVPADPPFTISATPWLFEQAPAPSVGRLTAPSATVAEAVMETVDAGGAGLQVSTPELTQTRSGPPGTGAGPAVAETVGTGGGDAWAAGGATGAGGDGVTTAGGAAAAGGEDVVGVVRIRWALAVPDAAGAAAPWDDCAGWPWAP